MKERTKTIDLYLGSTDSEYAALRNFNSGEYISWLFEECRNNDYEIVLDYFTTGEDDEIMTHYWKVSMIPECRDYEVMFIERFDSLMENFSKIAEADKLEDLSEDLREVHRQYLKPLTSEDMVREAYERHDYAGDAYASYLMTVYAQRLFKLMELGTPAIIINNEKRYFINAMIASSTWVREIRKV